MCALQAPRAGEPTRPPVLGAERWQHEARRIAAQTQAQLARFGITQEALQAFMKNQPLARTEVAESAQCALAQLEEQVSRHVMEAAVQPAVHARARTITSLYSPAVAQAESQLLDLLTALEGLQIRAHVEREVASLSDAERGEWGDLCAVLESVQSLPTGMRALSAEIAAPEAPRRSLALLAARRALELGHVHLPGESRAALRAFYAAPDRRRAIAQLRQQVLAPAHAAAEATAARVVEAVEALRAGHEEMPFLAAGTPDALAEGDDDNDYCVFWPFVD